MARCFHIHESGFQCVSETIEATDFCEAHQKVIPFERLEESRWRKFVLRAVAFLLLLSFLIPFLYSLKSLYKAPRAEAREVW